MYEVAKYEYISKSIVRRVQQPNVDLYPANTVLQNALFVS
jgi:hypothetical protein